jgi:isopentenyldiphosphate isomerase
MFPSRYDASVSFHVTYGETYEAAARREMLEEIGICSPVTYLGKFLHRDLPEYQIVAVFLSVSDDTPIIDPTEFSDYSFYSLSQVVDLIQNEKITPWLQDGLPFLKDHMKEIT